MIDFRGMTAGVIVLAAAFAANGAIAQDHAVELENRSRSTLCAEVDNVYVTLSGRNVDRFMVTAQHPAYIGTIVADTTAADHTNCDRVAEQYFEFDTRRVTLYEDRAIWLIGYVYERYWLTKDVPVRVGDRVEHGLHMIQLWRQGPRGPEEFLVLYPPDGYWRLRPLTPKHLQQTAYGSSVLIGPVEEKRRPVVEISNVTFDPQAREFELTFDRGGTATVAIAQAEETGTVLNIAMEGVKFVDDPDRETFAAPRSMYVAPGNADVSAVGWRSADDPFWTVDSLPDFSSAADVREVWLGRNIVSRHNTSAPDIVFGQFAAE